MDQIQNLKSEIYQSVKVAIECLKNNRDPKTVTAATAAAILAYFLYRVSNRRKPFPVLPDASLMKGHMDSFKGSSNFGQLLQQLHRKSGASVAYFRYIFNSRNEFQVFISSPVEYTS